MGCAASLPLPGASSKAAPSLDLETLTAILKRTGAPANAEKDLSRWRGVVIHSKERSGSTAPNTPTASGPTPVAAAQDMEGRVKELSLPSCGLTGAVPDDVGYLRYVEVLRLCDNALSGAIPEAVGRLFGLKSLFLDNNKLTGVLPDTLACCSSLEVLSVSNNSLSGPLPPFLALLASLKQLNVANNEFNGAIPKAIALLPALQLLDVSNNNLTGTVPNQLLLSSSLVLRFEGNALTAEAIVAAPAAAAAAAAAATKPLVAARAPRPAAAAPSVAAAAPLPPETKRQPSDKATTAAASGAMAGGSKSSGSVAVEAKAAAAPTIASQLAMVRRQPTADGRKRPSTGAPMPGAAAVRVPAAAADVAALTTESVTATAAAAPEKAAPEQAASAGISSSSSNSKDEGMTRGGSRVRKMDVPGLDLRDIQEGVDAQVASEMMRLRDLAQQMVAALAPTVDTAAASAAAMPPLAGTTAGATPTASDWQAIAAQEAARQLYAPDTGHSVQTFMSEFDADDADLTSDAPSPMPLPLPGPQRQLRPLAATAGAGAAAPTVVERCAEPQEAPLARWSGSAVSAVPLAASVQTRAPAAAPATTTLALRDETPWQLQQHYQTASPTRSEASYRSWRRDTWSPAVAATRNSWNSTADNRSGESAVGVAPAAVSAAKEAKSIPPAWMTDPDGNINLGGGRGNYKPTPVLGVGVAAKPGTPLPAANPSDWRTAAFMNVWSTNGTRASAAPSVYAPSVARTPHSVYDGGLASARSHRSVLGDWRSGGVADWRSGGGAAYYGYAAQTPGRTPGARSVRADSGGHEWEADTPTSHGAVHGAASSQQPPRQYVEMPTNLMAEPRRRQPSGGGSGSGYRFDSYGEVEDESANQAALQDFMRKMKAQEGQRRNRR